MSSFLEQIFDDGYWERAWQEAGRLRRGKKGKEDAAQEEACWDRRAGHFDKNVGSEKGSARIDEILKFLGDENVLSPGMRIVDVGCGNGSITVALAPYAGEIIALDPSQKMLELLQKKVKSLGLTNVHCFKERWQEVDLEEKGWYEYFDLAFASMSPGVDSGETLRRLMDASRKYCYLSNFAGRKDRARSELWEQITGKPFAAKDLDIIYAFNLLYAWGYRPSVRFHRHYRNELMEPAAAVEELFQFMEAAAGAGAEAKKTVEQYVTARLENNLFKYELEIYQGMLIWDKNIHS